MEIRTFDSAVAIVTGGASGIGAALGRELAKRGCEVVLADRQIDLADIFAAKALDAVARNEAIIVLPGWWKLFWWLDRLFPV